MGFLGLGHSPEPGKDPQEGKESQEPGVPPTLTLFE